MNNSRLNTRRLGIILCFAFPIFLFCSIGGDYFGWMSNQACYSLLGCNIGFFGYDALMHVFSGFLEVTFILWLVRTQLGWNPFGSSFMTNIITMVALCVLLGVLWEIGEYIDDAYRLYVLHYQLLQPDLLAQASNADTMGDLTLGMLSAVVSTFVYKAIDRKVL